MRLNEEISVDEYVIKKEELLKDKRKYEELISDSSKRVETWLDRAETLFSFAETAKNRFENGSFETKRQILCSLGSNLFLEDKKLIISADNNLAILKSLAPEVRELHSRLEPIKSQSSQEVWEEIYAQDEKVGPLLDVFRTKILELNKESFIKNIQQLFQINNMQPHTVDQL